MIGVLSPGKHSEQDYSKILSCKDKKFDKDTVLF